MLKLRSSAGYTLIELMVSTTIMMVVMGAIFALVNPASGTARVQPEFADMQQRARVGAETLFKDLIIAGAGPYMKNQTSAMISGQTQQVTGSLLNYFAPILPYRTGQVAPDPPGSFRSDAITIMYVPNTPAQTSIRNDMPDASTELKVTAQDNCPMQGSTRDPLCGFRTGDSVLIFDTSSGSFDSFVITNTQSDAMHVQHRGPDNTLAMDYGVGSPITELQNHTYYFDQQQNQLRHYDGLQTDVPVLDNVVGLSFTYYGDPNPPLTPKPAASVGQENCVIDTAGSPKLPTLAQDTGSIVKLDPSLFTSLAGQSWCGGGSNAFDPDLLRIRKIEIRVRVQTGDDTMRGYDTRLFTKPGRGGAAMVPDYELRFEITPRNMNLVR
jgi:hypothetical protein